jgi:hypothetical protein
MSLMYSKCITECAKRERSAILGTSEHYVLIIYPKVIDKDKYGV